MFCVIYILYKHKFGWCTFIQPLFRTLPLQCAGTLLHLWPNGGSSLASRHLWHWPAVRGGGWDFWCWWCAQSSPLEMVQTRVSVYDMETRFRVHWLFCQDDTDTDFHVQHRNLFPCQFALLRLSWHTHGLLCLTQKFVSMSATEICFCVRNRNLFLFTIHCTLI
jgi:hypothetical protein